MNLTDEQTNALNALKIHAEVWYDPKAYTSPTILGKDETDLLKRLEQHSLCEGNGIGFRLTSKGARALRWGKFKPIKQKGE